MKPTIIIGIIVIIIFIYMFGIPRIFKTLWLIARIEPYERHIPNASRILILGDSTGYGTGAKNSSETIAGRIGSDFPTFTIENKSTNGRKIEELQKEAEKLPDGYELILLQIGANNILKKDDVTNVEHDLRMLVDILSPKTKHLFMISSGNVGGASAFSPEESQDYESRTRVFRAMFVKVGDETALMYIDLFKERSDDVFVKKPEVYLALDGLHPSDAGYGVWYESLRPYLFEVLKEGR